MIKILEKEMLLCDVAELMLHHFDVKQNIELIKRYEYFFNNATNQNALIHTLSFEVIINDIKKIDFLRSEDVLRVNSLADLAMLYTISRNEKYKNESIKVVCLCGTKEEINFYEVYKKTLMSVYSSFNKESKDLDLFETKYGKPFLYIKGARKSPLSTVLHHDKYKDFKIKSNKSDGDYIFCRKCKVKHKYSSNLIIIEHRNTRHINGRYEIGDFRISVTFKCKNAKCGYKYVIKLQEFEAEILELSDSELQKWSLEKIKSVSNEK